ncbi:cupin domain-containing protein [Nostoc sp. DedQUE09]|uniref:cupin domain-containing protein n=1 Tax=Nostoc sp. DedQUE09 TaxID=3075394 RepID=UPI002AD3AA31|nr:cupin domain-containing protein [Nostoc sp. DedQUE09]MDZ7954279.1 cupin domain-containing protein [Nostoc sp. DedQUE09]
MFNLKKFLIVILIGTFCFVSFNVSLKAAQGQATEQSNSSHTEYSPFITVASNTPTPTYSLFDSKFKFLAEGKDTADGYSAYQVTIEKHDGGLPIAFHYRDVTALLVLDGELGLKVNGDVVNAPAGTFAYIPAKSRYAITNSGTEPAKFLLYSFNEGSSKSPTPLERLIKTAGVPVDNFSGWSSPVGNQRLIEKIALKNGIDFRAPFYAFNFYPFFNRFNFRAPFYAFNKDKTNHNYLVVLPDARDRPVYDSIGGRYTYLATDEETNGKFTFASVVNPAGNAIVPHRHKNEDELYSILSGGNFSILMNDKITTATPGTFALLGRGHQHAWITTGTTETRLICLFTPAFFGNFFKDVGTPVTDLNAPIAPSASPEKIASIAINKYHIEFVNQPNWPPQIN